MAQGLLDHERIARNWERAEAELSEPGPSRLEHVRAPLDPFAAAAPLLARLCTEIEAQYPEQRATLAPFIARVTQLLDRMQTERPATPELGLQLRERFVAALNDLEDLCEALLHLPR